MTEAEAWDRIHAYRRCQAVHAGVDFSDPVSVAEANAAADRMRALAAEWGQDPTVQACFETLLWDANGPLAKWAAHHLLELMSPSPRGKAQALLILEGAARGDSAEAMGERMWLDAWRSSHAP